MKPHPVIVAIDGTSASGKSTAARLLAEMLGYTYVDTGAMYRSLAWYCVKKKIDAADPAAVIKACRFWKTSLRLAGQPSPHVQFLVDGVCHEDELRTPEVAAAASHIAAVPKIRLWMKKKQRECAQFGDLVMEGRDIGTNVFPETDYKFYLDASLSERTKRRKAEGVNDNLAARDHRDSQRAAAPLMMALGACFIDTSGLSPEQTNRIIMSEFKRRLSNAKT